MKLLVLLMPNVLTLARLLLGLALPLLPAAWRLPACAFAGLSDLLDGTFSRCLGGTSFFGRVLDPIADKVFVVALLFVLLSDGELSVAEVALVGLRDIAVVFGAGVACACRRWELFHRLAPTWAGKVATVAQFLFLLSVLSAGQPGRQPAFLLATLLSAAAGLDYLRRFVHLWRAPICPIE